MNKQGPIIVIEDDEDDRHILATVFEDLGYSNEVVYLKDGASALTYLKDATICPFIILSDINLPKLNGFELRKAVQDNEGLCAKCIPYLFFSTSVTRTTVKDAYDLCVQGVFLKPHGFAELVDMMRKIIEYWLVCYSPNSYES
jgi:CheY-like chemotaxis protein